MSRPSGSGTCIIILAGGSTGNVLGEDLVDDREIGHVGKEHRRVATSSGRLPPRRSTNSRLLHRLPRLVAKRGTRGLARLGVDAGCPET
jgi:hypothetical protein